MTSKERRVKAREIIGTRNNRLALIYLIIIAAIGAASGIVAQFGAIFIVADIQISLTTGNTINLFSTIFSGVSSLVVEIFLASVFYIALARIIARVYNSKSYPSVVDTFSGFNSNYFQYVGITALNCLYQFLWGFWSLGIGAIVVALRNAMIYYIKNDHPEYSCKQVLAESRKMMKGHKWQLFKLYFSYLGWLILCGLTLGALTCWVYPRMYMATYTLYAEINPSYTITIEEN